MDMSWDYGYGYVVDRIYNKSSSCHDASTIIRRAFHLYPVR